MSDEDIFKLLAKAKKERRKRFRKVNSPDINGYRKEFRTQSREKKKMHTSLQKPFIGVDGEGAGDGFNHIYWLLRIGERALWHEDGSELNSLELLKWLAQLGSAGIMDQFIPVSYFFDYDTTMILRHLPDKNLKELNYNGIICQRRSCLHSKQSHVKGYNACFMPDCKCPSLIRGGQTTIFLGEKYINIRLSHRQIKVGWNKEPGITITDVGDLFQTSFLKTLEKWQHVEGEADLCTNEELERIRINKERRGSFTIGFDLETFDYNKLEVELLEELMERFRKMCYSQGVFPDMWTGPGRLAEDIFKSENVPMRKDISLPPFIEMLSDYAYYGGRMEGIHFGEHKNVIAYDIASAYPWAYTKLPCLLKGHGKWETVDFQKVQSDNLQNTLVLGHVAVNSVSNEPPAVCGLPMRDKKGRITFPTDAYGCWWYPEMRETISLYNKWGYNYKLDIETCITWNQTCNDEPGSFCKKWFDKRVSVGKSTRGIPIKLALNSLYGKAAQRVGSPKWANVVWAGLLTSLTRARLLEATTILGPSNIISYQTDGIFSKVPTLDDAVEAPGYLGQWEYEVYDELFLIQSGIYSAVDKDGKRVNKTRGMRDFEFAAAYKDIKEAWEADKWWGSFDLPDRNTFVTIRLGLQWGKPELIGTWLKQSRRLRFTSNIDKREIWGMSIEPSADGRTWAPGPIHAKIHKLEYGPHPIRKDGNDGRFSYPYNRALADALNAIRRAEENTYSYISPDEPYTINED